MLGAGGASIRRPQRTPDRDVGYLNECVDRVLLPALLERSDPASPRAARKHPNTSAWVLTRTVPNNRRVAR
jgi:hypothetical protein